MRIELFDVGDKDRLSASLEVRFEVFVDEQGVPREEEIDGHDRDDPDAVHAIVRDACGRTIAAGRFYTVAPGIAQIGRMAVRKESRGRGVGAALLEALIVEARRRRHAEVRLDAQIGAVGFYRRAGFAPAGATLWDAGILHQPMRRKLGEP